MAVFDTTTAESKVQGTTNVQENEASASSYIMEAGAFLSATDFLQHNILLGGLGAWTVAIDGQSFGDSTGLYITGAGAAAKITIGESGSVSSAFNAAISIERAASVLNKGTVIGMVDFGVRFNGDGTSTFTNLGLIAGGSGSITFEGLLSSDTVTNSGSIVGDVIFGEGTNKLVNSGLITNTKDSPEFAGFGATTSNILFGSGADTFDNKGVIDGYIDLGDGLNKGTNAKSITGKDGNDVTVLAGSGNDTFTNAKGATLAGGVNLGNGMNVFTNAGTVGEDNTGASYTGSNDLLAIDTVKNSGTLDGDVNLFAGNDVFTNTGQVLGIIDLGDGNDVFKGGNFAEFVLDNAGSDKIALGGGNDTFEAFGGEGDGKDGLMGNPAPDDVDGGTGIDTYDGSAVPLAGFDGILVNLDSIDQTSKFWIIPTLTITKGTATDAAGIYIDKLKGFENVGGGGGDDIIFGSAAANTIQGLSGSDELHGLAGNDVIDGGLGNDYLAGGLGADVLTGGADVDYFFYSSIKDSGVTKATRDEIMDFEDGTDKFELFAIDAIAATASVNDSFSSLLLGNGTFTAAGQLRVYQTATGWMIEGEVTGDNKADFSIAVRDLDHSISWGTDNFVL